MHRAEHCPTRLAACTIFLLPEQRVVFLLVFTLAEVAELADAHGSGPCTRKGVGVRVPSSAPISKQATRSAASDSSGMNHPVRI